MHIGRQRERLERHAVTEAFAGSRAAFYTTPPHVCSYLPPRQATTLFTDPALPKDRGLYSILSEQGFRRSGAHLYRPSCPGCQACIPVRIPVQEFRPRRNQRRTWDGNRDLHVVPGRAGFRVEYFDLYRRYLRARHPNGGMDDPSPEGFMDFLTAPWAETLFYEFRLGDRLLAIAVVDRLEHALSAVYTFYDPACRERSLGRYAILHEIQEARAHGLAWLYLGYWIAGCRKMRYKNEYQPLEYYVGGRWERARTVSAGR